MMSATWRITNFIMTMFFSLAAYVQINDPDSLIWLAIYIMPAVLCLSIVVSPEVAGTSLWQMVCCGHIAVCCAGIAMLSPTVFSLLSDSQISVLDIEEGRETGGLFIIVVWLSFCLSSKQQKEHFTTGKIVAILTMVSVPVCLWAVCYLHIFQQNFSYCQHICGNS